MVVAGEPDARVHHKPKRQPAADAKTPGTMHMPVGRADIAHQASLVPAIGLHGIHQKGET